MGLERGDKDGSERLQLVRVVNSPEFGIGWRCLSRFERHDNLLIEQVINVVEEREGVVGESPSQEQATRYEFLFLSEHLMEDGFVKDDKVSRRDWNELFSRVEVFVLFFWNGSKASTVGWLLRAWNARKVLSL